MNINIYNLFYICTLACIIWALFLRINLFVLVSRFFCRISSWEKMRSAQRQVELRRLDNQLPVLGKPNSVSKMLCICLPSSCLLSCDF